MPVPFQNFLEDALPQSELRQCITAAYRRPETECLPPLISAATLCAAKVRATQTLATELVAALRYKKLAGGSGVEGLIQEYSLSSQEGIALMCLAEALLRIPDSATRDALIRDKISTADWQVHLGQSPSLFVNAATWGLLVTGKLTATSSERGLSAALTRLIGRGGEPLIRKGVDLGMRMMGEQFVTGQTIEEALSNSRNMEARGFRYSFDCLGEGAMTTADAERYCAAYEQAIHAIGKAADGKGVYEGPGISVKLSALHPRYSRAQAGRVRRELLPRLMSLARLARRYDIALNIDAEEADRLEISLDLLEALCFDPELVGWSGIGFVIQAYQKRCRAVIDWLVDLARRSNHRLMVRLVKGAYWDSEIKRAQVDGLEDFPVFTRKLHTDVSYLACAQALLAAPDAVFPQFATHNAHTLSAIIHMAEGNYYAGQYEFQCLHGMGEPLYDEVVGADKLNRPCRIYAPVGTHETLLAYLVRRLLENGANTSFVHRIANPAIAIEELVADPVAQAQKITPLGASHVSITLPRDLFGAERRNSFGLDLSNEQRLRTLSEALRAGVAQTYTAEPPAGGVGRTGRSMRNPADHRDVVGTVVDATPDQVATACAVAAAAAAHWGATAPGERARVLARAADLMEERLPALLGPIVRESGKSVPNAVAEVREAVDFLRYYGAQAVATLGGTAPEGAAPGSPVARPLGPVVCISPWNFPLAIFVGQVGAALAAGNPVLAKPAAETPLIAALAVRLLHEAGIPADVLQLLPGPGDIGAALVADTRTCGVLFTGSTAVARLIQGQLAERLSPAGLAGAGGTAIPLIAETGGQNALIVDSSALPEQVVADALISAFDSAGQRCSALRILCLQDEIAARVLTMLKGAMQELVVGNPDRVNTDIGPVISAKAQTLLTAHIDAMRASGHSIWQCPLPSSASAGTFVPPTLIEISAIAELKGEVFGPVLHVLRYQRKDLSALIDAINATGYGLTFGLHTRIDETIAQVTQRITAGNLYVNRNLIGAVVGVQPFGGHGLSGTGPKAGGPLYLRRLVCPAAPGAATDSPVSTQAHPPRPPRALPAAATAYRDFLTASGLLAVAGRVTRYLDHGTLESSLELPGPVGERNLYVLKPRGRVLALADSAVGILIQIGAILTMGNEAVVEQDNPAARELARLPKAVAAQITTVPHWWAAENLAAVLFAGTSARLISVNQIIARRDGPILVVQSATTTGLEAGSEDYALDFLVSEVSISTNTAAAGGNAKLMTLG